MPKRPSTLPIKVSVAAYNGAEWTCQQHRGDRGHPRREGQRLLGTFPHREPVFEDFLVRAVEARIDQPFGPAGALAGDAFEVAFARRGAFENIGRGQEDRRLERAFGQARIVAVPHHQRRWLERPAADRARLCARPPARLGAGEIGLGFAFVAGHGAYRKNRR
jgi:hypothetical protein